MTDNIVEIVTKKPIFKNGFTNIVVKLYISSETIEYKITLLKEEYELIKFLLDKLNFEDRKKLFNLIEDYAQTRYNEGFSEGEHYEYQQHE